MKRSAILLAGLLGLTAVPVAAQYGSDVESFVNAIRTRDGNAALEILGSRGALVLNARNGKGETALLVAIGNRDDRWTRYLLQQGADPDLAARDGDRPLIAAARIGYGEAVDWLLAKDAKVDAGNRHGETALIIAVQQKQGQIVRALLNEGADPDKKDSRAGYSARDYARQDTRSRELLAMIESARKPKAQTLDDFKLE